jgi:hypothetical protein
MAEVTKKQFDEAMAVVQAYLSQLAETEQPLSASSIGCRVSVSKFGRENLAACYHKAKGAVVDWLQWSSPRDGLVTVKFDGFDKPVIMHIDNISPIPK